jgi:catechol 2,3-dioxygenase-like lactoylglutathione lyase family enzyme
VLSTSPLVAFVPARDLERSRAFYVGVLGLRLVEVTAYACVLEAAGTTLRVTKVDDLVPQPFTVLGWHVSNVRALDDLVAALSAAGVALLRYPGMGQDDAGVWTTPGGDRIAWFHDPDGNVLSLTALSPP